jgi:hypothetical protein
LKHLKAEGVPVEGMHALHVLKGQRFETEDAFLQAVEKQLGAEARGQYRSLFLKLGEGAGKFNAVTYEAFLRQLLESITVPIILIEDGASYHRSQTVEQSGVDLGPPTAAPRARPRCPRHAFHPPLELLERLPGAGAQGLIPRRSLSTKSEDGSLYLGHIG